MMLYNKNLLVKRLLESDKELLTEKELLSLATPYINNIDQVIEVVKYAVDFGYTGQYSINKMSIITTISRQTLYRWEKDGIICRTNNKLSIIDLYDTLKMIEMRQMR